MKRDKTSGLENFSYYIHSTQCIHISGLICEAMKMALNTWWFLHVQQIIIKTHRFFDGFLYTGERFRSLLNNPLCLHLSPIFTSCPFSDAEATLKTENLTNVRFPEWICIRNLFILWFIFFNFKCVIRFDFYL